MFQSFIPYHKIEPRRKTRSLLPFVGYVSKSLYVTATMDDVNISAPQINALTKTSNNIIYALQKHNEHMPSFVSTANNCVNSKQKNGLSTICNISNLSLKTLQA